MSAWIVSEAHINVLVRALLDRGIIKHEPTTEARNAIATETGKLLLDTCIESVMYRYPGESVAAMPGTTLDNARWEREGTESYSYTDPGFEPTELEASYAARCYSYQSCEHPGWESSKAYQLTEVALADRTDPRPYGDAEQGPWGWDQSDIDRRRSHV